MTHNQLYLESSDILTLSAEDMRAFQDMPKNDEYDNEIVVTDLSTGYAWSVWREDCGADYCFCAANGCMV